MENMAAASRMQEEICDWTDCLLFKTMVNINNIWEGFKFEPLKRHWARGELTLQHHFPETNCLSPESTVRSRREGKKYR